MKHVIQDKFECSLAVLAMVSGAKYSLIQTYAYAQFPERVGKGYHAKQVKQIWEHFSVPYIEFEEYRQAPVMNLFDLKLNGCGHILFRCTRMIMWHHIAYQSGWVHDAQKRQAWRLKPWARDRQIESGDDTYSCKIIQRRLF